MISTAHPTLDFASDRIVQSCDVAYEWARTPIAEIT